MTGILFTGYVSITPTIGFMTIPDHSEQMRVAKIPNTQTTKVQIDGLRV